MADFQFQPNMADPVAKLRNAMDRMDGEHCRSAVLYSMLSVYNV